MIFRALDWEIPVGAKVGRHLPRLDRDRPSGAEVTSYAQIEGT